jgi:hypothetical protein
VDQEVVPVAIVQEAQTAQVAPEEVEINLHKK